MEGERASAGLLKLLFNLCFAALFFEVIALAEWILLLTMTPRSPLARLVPLLAVLLSAQVVALIFYFRKPWVAVLVAWAGVFLIAARAIPWGSPTWRSVIHEFYSQIVFLLVAHAGFGVSVLRNRAKAEESAEPSSAAEETPIVTK